MTTRTIKNLLFDLGGVIMDIRRERAVEALESIGLSQAGELLGEYAQSGVFEQLESGKISATEWRNRLRGMIEHPVTDEQIDHAWGQFLLGIPVHRLRKLEQLGRHYRICMLSNTNPVMWAQGIDRAFRADGHDVHHYFGNDIIKSYEAGVMKPDERIFRYAVEKLGIKPEETLFLDDSSANCEAARALGLYAACVPVGTEMIDVIDRTLS